MTSQSSVLQCASTEDASVVSPADATWMCEYCLEAGYKTKNAYFLCLEPGLQQHLELSLRGPCRRDEQHVRKQPVTVAVASKGQYEDGLPSHARRIAHVSGDETGTSFFQTVSNDTQFSVNCGGCDSATPSPTTAITPAPTIIVGSDNCGVLTVASPPAPFLEGCYFNTGYEGTSWYESSSYYNPVYGDMLPVFTQDGTDNAGQIWISAVSFGEEFVANQVRRLSTGEFAQFDVKSVHQEPQCCCARYLTFLPRALTACSQVEMR